jgi:threonine/homoserine/homoserine lactone efflux protein
VKGTFLLIFVMMRVSASFWLFFVYTLDRPSVRDIIERSQQTVNRIVGALLLLLGLRMAFMRR